MVFFSNWSGLNNQYSISKQVRIPIKKVVKKGNFNRKISKPAKLLRNMKKLFAKRQIERFSIFICILGPHMESKLAKKNYHLNSRKLLDAKLNGSTPKDRWAICGMKIIYENIWNYAMKLKINRTITDGSDHFEGAFRRAIWPFLVIGQFYGVGVSSRPLSKLHFKWNCFRTIFAIIVAIILSGYSLFLLWKIFTDAAYFYMSMWQYDYIRLRKNITKFHCFRKSLRKKRSHEKVN